MPASFRNSCLLCVPLVCQTVEEVLSQMHIAKEQGADCVEVRIDHLKAFNPASDLQTILKARPLPALITYRPKWEGGQYDGEEAARLDTLRLALEYEADYIDVELQVADEFIKSISNMKRTNTKIIVSNHNYQYTPSLEDLGALVARIQSVGADIVKIATTAKSITDTAKIFSLLAKSQVPVIALVMAERGLISRLLSPKFGGYLTFGTIGAGKESAPGQPTISDLIHTYRLRSLGRETKVFGLIGNPVSHSKGPILHNAAFRELGFDAVYVPLPVEDIKEFLQVFSSPDFAGFSVTVPHKEAAVKCCDEVEPVAQSIGAVNTIIRRPSDGKLIGYNTDYVGAISAIEDGLISLGHRNLGNSGHLSPLNGKLFVVIGAGGAGRALAFGAQQKGARVVIANRNFEKAKYLAGQVGGEALPLDKLGSFCPETGMILANSTSMGMLPNVDVTPIPKEALSSYLLVFDAVYTPKFTRLLIESQEAGAAIVSGVEMFIRQGIRQSELFTGSKPPENLMREIISKSTGA